MDRLTVEAYDADPQGFADRWDAQAQPSTLHARFKAQFKPGPTADIGCGSGREAAWLQVNGFPVIGYDASQGLLARARALYPHLRFEFAALPELAGVAPCSFENVVCRTVIMHLPREQIAPAVRRLRELLKPGGTLYLSWRVTKGADQRDEHGRLYSVFEAGVVGEALKGLPILFEEEVTRPSGQVLHRLMAQAI